MKNSLLTNGLGKRSLGEEAKHGRSALGDVSNSNSNTGTGVFPGKLRRSSRLSGSDPNGETVATSNSAHDGRVLRSKCERKTKTLSDRNTSRESRSDEQIQESTGELKTKRRRVDTRRSSSSSVFGNDTHEHTTIFAMNVPSPFDASKYTLGFSKHDKGTIGNVLQAPEYVCDIFQRLFQSETNRQKESSRLHPSMDNQPELNPTMRMIVVDWLVEVHSKFRLDPATLHLCVHIFDRFLSVREVSRRQVQLVAVTSLLLASKYEEIYPPAVKDCVYVTDKAYTHDDILEMETEILAKLNYSISEPTGYPFLRRFLFIANASPLMEVAANYYMDRMLQELDYLKHRPSLFAVSAVCLAINNDDIRASDGIDSKYKPGIPHSLLEYTGFSASEIVEVARLIVSKLSKSVVLASKRQLFAVKEKYSHSDYMRIAVDISPPEVTDLGDRKGRKRS